MCEGETKFELLIMLISDKMIKTCVCTFGFVKRNDQKVKTHCRLHRGNFFSLSFRIIGFTLERHNNVDIWHCHSLINKVSCCVMMSTVYIPVLQDIQYYYVDCYCIVYRAFLFLSISAVTVPAVVIVVSVSHIAHYKT